MAHCSIPSCLSAYTKKSSSISLFSYPVKHPEILKKWKWQIKENYPDFTFGDIKTAKVCQFHFEDKYMIRTGKERRFLTFDAVPTLFGSDIVKNVKEAKTIRKTIGRPRKQPALMMNINRKRRQKTQPKKLEKYPSIFASKVLPHNLTQIEIYKQCCRLCLKRLKEGETEFIEDGARNNMEITLNVHLNPSTEYPRFMCKSCVQHVEKFEKYRSKVVKSQEALSRIFKNVVAKPAPVIKEEPIEIVSNFPPKTENWEIGSIEKVQDFEITNYEPINSQKVQEVNYNAQFENFIIKVEPEEPKIVEQNTFNGNDTSRTRSVSAEDYNQPEKSQLRKQSNASNVSFTRMKQFHYQKIPCRICGEKIPRGCLSSHMLSHHDIDSSEESVTKKRLNSDITSFRKSFFKKIDRKAENARQKKFNYEKIPCNYCGKKVARVWMVSHKASLHDPNRPLFECDACGVKFRMKQTMEKHVQVHVIAKQIQSSIERNMENKKSDIRYIYMSPLKNVRYHI